VNPGDHIVLSANKSLGSSLDPTIAMFDQDQDLFAQNDDIDAAGGNFDSQIDAVIRQAGDHFYVAISSSYFSSQSGQYTADLQIIRRDPPVPASQKLMLNFVGGAAINIPNVGTFDIAPFDAARVDPIYAGQTAQIKAGIAARVRHCYANFNVIVQTS